MVGRRPTPPLLFEVGVEVNLEILAAKVSIQIALSQELVPFLD